MLEVAKMSKFTLSEREMDKMYYLKQLKERKLTQIEVAEQLKLSVRQVSRIAILFKNHGMDGLKRHKTTGNRSFAEAFKNNAIQIIRQHYADFGPTLASEKLESDHALKVNRETLRKWMREAGFWKSKARKKARIHQSRERRSRFGELVQIDGSHHDWFEGRSPKCCLLVFVDDATSQIVSMRFEAAETTIGYMRAIYSHIRAYGRPMAYYSDKHSIFRTNKDNDKDYSDTQVHRALKELHIERSYAHSSQAKGRVERAHQTLQDRLIKEMRLKGISSIDEGNQFLPRFMAWYNQRFGVKAAIAEDAHLELHSSNAELMRVLSVKKERKLSKNLEFSLEKTKYKITTATTGYRLCYQLIQIYEHMDGDLEALCNNQELKYQIVGKRKNRISIDSKELNVIVDSILFARPADTANVTFTTGPTAPIQPSL